MFVLHIIKNDFMNCRCGKKCGSIYLHGYEIRYWLQKNKLYKRGYHISYMFNNKCFSNLVKLNNYIESLCDEETLWKKI
jgi:hypothetical protein